MAWYLILLLNLKHFELNIINVDVDVHWLFAQMVTVELEMLTIERKLNAHNFSRLQTKCSESLIQL